jgi:hypothetical protein
MRRALLVGMASLASAAAVAVVLVVVTGDDPYADLRQSSRQPIPGTLGYELEPPPADAQPTLAPSEVRRRYPAQGGDVQVAFASIRDTLEGRSIGPGWVLFARGVCLRNSKGELVSDARGNDPVDLECTDTTLWILAVDPVTAEPLMALIGHDERGAFGPDVAG